MLASSTSTQHTPLSRPHSSASCSSTLLPSKRLRFSSNSPDIKPSYTQLSSTGAPANIVNTSHIPIDDIDLYMPNSHDFNPSQNNSYPYGLNESHDNLSMWTAVGGGNVGVANSMGSYIRQGQNHERHPSISSIGSTASAATSSYPVQQGPRGSGQFAKSASISRGTHQRNHSSSRSHLPTPTQTPTRSSFLNQQSSGISQDLSQVVQASLVLQQQSGYARGEGDAPQMSHSQRQSFSSMGQAPATTMSTGADRHDDGQQLMNNDMMSGPPVPKFNRTLTDAYQDSLYFPSQPQITQSQQVTNPAYLMATNGMMNERLQAAQMARSQSSGSNQSAPMSPFRYGRNDADEHETKYQLSPHSESAPKTISPKDAVLDYNSTSGDYPLFPQHSSTAVNNSYAAVAPSQRNSQQFPDTSAIDFSSNGQTWGSSMQQFSSAPLQSYSSFATPALPPQNMNTSNMGFMSSPMTQPSRNARRQIERTPEFNPAQLTRMESSASEAPQSSQASSAQIIASPKPDSAADSGTYSCTYHGCIQRFTTPQKLQKHKRDAHRNNPNVTPGVGSGMSTAELMERNSQTGPHICGRTNPQTGKACDAVFSRPYDLTRHEDTIHNNRKQKVRCAICVEDKTFSRSDALTRHMRVVHPEVDFPGKHRKRGSRDE